ncbi:MAG: hypothetical protein JWO36_6847 [Myxococcales bacterium]|nr:hypothetical protein [Myxococcales bacterium]
MRVHASLVVLAITHTAAAQVWQDATARCVGTTAEWSNKIEVADVDGDGNVDLLIANGGNYSSKGTPERARIFRNLGAWDQAGSRCTDISAQAIGGFSGLSRMIKAADIDGDGDLDIFTGGAYQTQAVLYLRGATGWTDATAQLPQQLTSIGDAEFGDVDGDGDLDIVIADWGTQAPGAVGYIGGRTRLYRNDGAGHFTDDTAAAMPPQLVKWSWDLELVDIDNDWDLDILVSSKLDTTSFVFRNDGTGHFTADPNALPHFRNNYELQPMDIDGDGDLDLATVNDGPNSTNHIFVNDGHGMFTDETQARLTGAANPPADDNAVVWLDVDSDGDADMLVASLGAERLLLNDGQGHFTLSPTAATPNDTPSTLGIAIADLDGDGRADVVQAQGEQAFGDKVQLASSAVAIDTSKPVIAVESIGFAAGGRVHARVHDHQGPSHLHDWRQVVLRYTIAHAAPQDIAMKWYGEFLWAADLPPIADMSPETGYAVCATDRAGNEGCSTFIHATNGGDGGIGGDAGTTPASAGGCCDAGNGPAGSLLPIAFVLLLRRRRSR